MCSHIDTQTHAGRLGLEFDLLTSGSDWSVHAEVLPCTICLLTLVLIAQTVFLLERGQTDRRDWMPYPTPAAIQPSWLIIVSYLCASHSNINWPCLQFQISVHTCSHLINNVHNTSCCRHVRITYTGQPP